MHMILENCHHFVLIEEGDPVEQSVQESLRVFVESIANAVDGYMVVNKFDLFSTLFKGFFDEIFLDAVERVEIAWIQDGVTDLSPFEIEETPPIFHIGHPINYLSIFTPLELLREVFEEGSRVKGDIGMRELVKSSIVISKGKYKRDNIANLIRNHFHLLEEEIPGIGTCGNIVVIGDISPNKYDVRFETNGQFW